MEKSKIYWVSRHELTIEQVDAMIELHGNIEIKHEDIRFTSACGLYDFIREHQEGYVYSIAGGVHYLYAFEKGLEFYLFEPSYISQEVIHIRAIWKCQGGRMSEVWKNVSSYEYKS